MVTTWASEHCTTAA